MISNFSKRFFLSSFSGLLFASVVGGESQVLAMDKDKIQKNTVAQIKNKNKGIKSPLLNITKNNLKKRGNSLSISNDSLGSVISTDSEESPTLKKSEENSSNETEDNSIESSENTSIKKINKKDLSDFQTYTKKSIKTLAKKFNETPEREGALRGSGKYERTLIALSSLLMEKTGCAAVMLKNDTLWVARNSGNQSSVQNLMNLFSNLISSSVSLNKNKREYLLKNKEVRKILPEVSSARASKEQQENTIVRTANQMIHWLKKIVSLRKYKTKNNEDGIIARALINKKIKYIDANGPHAEMNILDKLNECNSLEKGGNFIAISKKCCLYCAAAIQAVNEVILISHELPYEANGSHFNTYASWIIPKFLKENENILEKFLGSNAYKIYKENSHDTDELFNVIENSTKETKSRITRQSPTTTDSSNELRATSDEEISIIKKGKNKVKIKVENK